MRGSEENEADGRFVSGTPEERTAVEGLFPEEVAEGRRCLGVLFGPAVAGGARAGRRKSPEAGANEYRLRKGHKIWQLVFKGQQEVLKDERAVELVECLLKQPPEVPIHASVLEMRVDGSPLLDGLGQAGRGEEGRSAPGAAGSVGGVIEEATGRKLAGRDTLPAWKAELAELRATMADDTLPNAEREEAREKLTALLKARSRGGRFVGSAGRAADRVRKQIKTFIKELKGAMATRGRPNAVLRAFGQHLEDHLWLPSVGGRRRIGAAGKAGCFTYEPPPGVRWRD